MQGFWVVEGPYPAMPKTKKWRAEFRPSNRTGYDAGTGWAPTEKEARAKALRRALLRNRSRTTR